MFLCSSRLSYYVRQTCVTIKTELIFFSGVILYEAYHECDKEEADGPECNNFIYELELFYVAKDKKIITEDRLIKDSPAIRGKLWSLDYSYEMKQLFYTDISVEHMRWSIKIMYEIVTHVS